MAKSAVTVTVDEQEFFRQVLAGDASATFEEISEEIEKLKFLRTRLFKQVWTDFDWMTHRVSAMWDCDQSPLGKCVYHAYDDPALDDCIFCHQPNERK